MSKNWHACAICGSTDYESPHSDGVGLREQVPWEGGSVAHRGCAADVVRERARDADQNA